MFDKSIYVQRRKRLSELVGTGQGGTAQVDSGIVLMVGHDESPMNYADNPYAFRQDSSFLYYFGLDEPGLIALIDLDEGREIVFGNDRTVNEVIWMGPTASVQQKCERVGVDQSAPLDQLPPIIDEAIRQGRRIHFLPPSRPEVVMKLAALLGLQVDVVADYVSEPLTRAVVACRSVKAPEEIEEIQKAVDVCAEMQVAAMRLSKPGVCEREVAGAIEGIAIARGGRLSFPTIFSIHGETLHNHHHDNVMQQGHMAINDSGAETALHYAGDITRTIPVGGRFSSRQKDVYQIVFEAQSRAIEAVRPGVEFRDVHTLACEILAAGLKDLGLITGDIKEAVRAGAHALFFQCGLGHMMGLDVHDMEGLGEDYVGYTDTIRRNPMFGFCSLRLGKALEPNHVITVEPGLYFIPQLIDQWRAEQQHTEFIDYDAAEKFKDFGGIRLEDDLLVTDDGY
ncbi:MAG TPA: aminopeptidase P family protein, partial [Thermoguttaceae bacterium]|nr:aminopeptidase P family protein [Thermoguttaceae bacterium]